jgi:hypothetical protein
MIAAFLAFFALWELGFWILAILASIAFIAAAEKDLLPLGIITTILMAVIYHNPLVSLLAHPTMLVIGFVGWIVAGIIYSIAAWGRYISRKIKEKGSDRNSDLRYALALGRNKSRITNWIIFWPWSLFWNLTGNLFENIFEAMSGIYQKMVDRALAPLEAAQKLREEQEEVERKKRNEERERDEIEQRKSSANRQFGKY